MNQYPGKFELRDRSRNACSPLPFKDCPSSIYSEAYADTFKSRTVFWLMLFLSLNLLDTVLTNKAYAMLESVGLDGRIAEANLILQPFAGSWLFLLKGVFALVLMILADRFLKIPIRRTLTLACFALAVISLWNANSIGLL